MKRIIAVALALIIGLSVGYKMGDAEAKKKNISMMFRLFTNTLNYVKDYYVEEKDPPDLIEKAIEGMVHSLDPFSDFFTPEQTEEFKISTTGEFGGLGIQIGIRNGVVTVISPIEGTPAYRAGLRPGDKIIKIEDTSIIGWKLSDVVKRLRGKPGTKVTITISRPGVNEPLKFTITRAIIHIQAVPYFGLVDGNIGYIKLSSFQKNANVEVRKALDSLFAMGAKKIVLDLRGNPGGLLSEAIRTANLFLPQGALIVSTKGRVPNSNRDFFAPGKPSHGTDYPLAVLVSRGSASASEIVSGAIQDWDRGIIVGDTTFGKGSVQRVFPLQEGYQLKITTARYFTPSGRCIDRRTFGKKDTTRTPYYTKRLHRTVYGGGGIIPDVVKESELLAPLVSKAFAKGVFFDYAVKYYKSHEKPASPEEINLSDDQLKDFEKYMKEKGVKFTSCDFKDAKDQIKLVLEEEIAEKYFGRKGRYAVMLKKDTVFKKAVDILEHANKVDDLYSIMEHK